MDRLTPRSQFVSLTCNNKTQLSCYRNNTRASHGTVLASVLFSIQTNDNIPSIKYVDDTSIRARLRSESIFQSCQQEIRISAKSFEDHYQNVNVKMTKEIIFDFRIKVNNYFDTEINNEKN